MLDGGLDVDGDEDRDVEMTPGSRFTPINVSYPGSAASSGYGPGPVSGPVPVPFLL